MDISNIYCSQKVLKAIQTQVATYTSIVTGN